jgi:hypothetical protein
MTEYSTGEKVDSSINVHIVPRLGSRKLSSITPIVVERFLDELEADGVGRGNQVNVFRTLKAILRDAYGKVSLLRFDRHPWCGGQAARMVSYSAGLR